MVDFIANVKELMEKNEGNRGYSYSFAYDGERVVFSGVADMLNNVTVKAFAEEGACEEEFATECSLLLEPSIDWEDFESRWEHKDMNHWEVGEPGYPKIVLVGDWWEREEGELCNISEKWEFLIDLERYFGQDFADVFCSWDDEWTYCSVCYKGYRTQADSYSWKSRLVLFADAGEMVCENCINDDESITQDYLQQVENDPKSCVIIDVDMEKAGYVKYNGTYQNGLHTHMTDDPEAITKHLHSLGFPNIVFVVPSVSQFYVNFESWVRKSDVKCYSDEGNPIEGVGLTPATERYLKVTRDWGTEVTTVHEYLDTLHWSITDEKSQDIREALMCLDEGEDTVVEYMECDFSSNTKVPDIERVLRITKDCYQNHEEV